MQNKTDRKLPQYFIFIQVNLFQKHLFLPQLTHNMTKDYSLNPSSEHVVYINCSEYQDKKQFVCTVIYNPHDTVDKSTESGADYKIEIPCPTGLEIPQV